MIREELLDNKRGVTNQKATSLSIRATPYNEAEQSKNPRELTTIWSIKQDLDKKTLNDLEILEKCSHRTLSLKSRKPSASKKRYRGDACVEVLKDITSKILEISITDNARKPNTPGNTCKQTG